MPTENSPPDRFERPRLWSIFDYLVFAFLALSPVVYRSFNLLGLLIILLSVIIVFRYRAYLPTPSREMTWLIFLLTINLLLAVFYIAIGRDSLEIAKDPIRLMGMIPIVLAASIIGPRPDKLVLGLAVGMIGASMVVGYQAHVMEMERPGEIYNPNPFSEVAMVSGAALLCLIVLTRGWKKLLAVFGSLAAFYCVLVSETRGTLVAVIPMGLICLVVLARFRHFGAGLRVTARHKVVLAAGALILIGVTGLGIVLGSGILDRFNSAFENYSQYREDRTQITSVSIRLELWYSSWLTFKEAPLTGIGSDSRMAYLKDLESKGILHLGDYPWRHNHSDYFDSLQRQGLPGMLIVIGLYWVLFISYWRNLSDSTREQFALGLTGLLVITGYATFSVTEVPLRNSLTLVFFIALNGVLLGMLKRARENRDWDRDAIFAGPDSK